jgi:hypothetical protein
MYSAIIVKTGDATTRPVSAECLLVAVPENGHEELYQEIATVIETMEKSQREGVPELRIDRESLILDYVSAVPPAMPRSHEAWQRVKYLRDFPLLEMMARESAPDMALLRFPSRTLSAATIVAVSGQAELGVFRHSTASTSRPPEN